MIMEGSLGEILVKVGMFVLVQVLVYLILSNSSSVFSKTMKRSNSFRPVRSVSIRRMLAAFSDVPAGDGLSPSGKDHRPSIQEKRASAAGQTY